MLQKIGFFTICLGTMMADSECLLVPAVVVALGAVLLGIGIRRERMYG